MADCQTVDIQEPIPDESEVVPTITGLNSPSPETITLDVRLDNNITSGNGSNRTVTFTAALDTNQVVNESVTVAAGSSTTKSYEFTNAPTGSVTVEVDTDDGSDFQNVDVAEPVPDESEATTLLESASSPAPNELAATATVANEITSGDGEWLSVELLLTVDGNTVDSVGYDLRAGESRTHDFSVTGVSSGSSQVCAEVNVISRN